MTAGRIPVRRFLRWPRSLRARLVAVLLILLTAGLAAAAGVTDVVVHRVLIGQLDGQLRAAGDRFAVGLEHRDGDTEQPRNPFGSVQGQAAGTLGARIVDGRVTDAAIVAGHGASATVPPAARAKLATLTITGTPRTIDLPQLGGYRIMVAAGRDGDLQVTGLPTAPVDETIDKLIVAESIVFAVALVLVAAAATGLVRLMLRPLARVSATAKHVADLPLHSGAVSLPHRAPTGSHGAEVDTLARAFNAMLEQVEAALVTRAESEGKLRRFIADASHELRTPVAVVRSHAELAHRTGGAALPDDVVHSLGRITAQAHRMGRLVDDLLLLARLDSGRPLAREAVDLTRVALDAVDDARATNPDHRWRLALPPEPVIVDGDAHALAQVVTNVLANAAQHTPAGTTVELDLTAAEAGARGGDGAVELAICDDGPGMDADLVARAFDRFVRGDHRRMENSGSSGLGLPIVAAIVAAHGGSVSLDSDARGTRVTVRLPGRTGYGLPTRTHELHTAG